MITLTYTMVALLPTLVCLMACVALLPLLVMMHVRSAAMPTDAHHDLDSWDEVLACLDEERAPMVTRRMVQRVNRLSTGACYPVGYTPRRRRLGKRHANELIMAVYELPTSGCPPDSVRR